MTVSNYLLVVVRGAIQVTRRSYHYDLELPDLGRSARTWLQSFEAIVSSFDSAKNASKRRTSHPFHHLLSFGGSGRPMLKGAPGRGASGLGSRACGRLYKYSLASGKSWRHNDPKQKRISAL